MAKVTKDQLDKLVEKAKSIIADARKAHGFFTVLKALPALAGAAVRLTEDAAVELNIKGADKKELALDIVFAYVELPWWLPEAPLRMFAGRLIEAAVAKLNA